MKTLQNERVFPILMMVVASAAAVVAFAYPADSSGFVRAMSLLLLVFSAAEFWRVRRTSESESAAPSNTGTSQSQHRTALIVFVSAPFFIVLARLFDFEIAIFLFLVSAMVVFGYRKPVKTTLIALAVLLVVKLLFFELLDVSRAPTLVFGS